MPPVPEPQYPIPKFTLRVEDLAHPGASLFFQSVNPNLVLRNAVIASLKWLYTPETMPTNVESILLILRPMDGVAHTFGTHTDKEIHFSLDHIKNCAARAREEITGVLIHEVVHCYQYNAKGTCPGGLIEGIADYVRLHAEYGHPHWKRSGGGQWDAGYDKTAYFLNWIEGQYAGASVRTLNQAMKDNEYDERVFEAATGKSVRELWRLYCLTL